MVNKKVIIIKKKKEIYHTITFFIYYSCMYYEACNKNQVTALTMSIIVHIKWSNTYISCSYKHRFK